MQLADGSMHPIAIGGMHLPLEAAIDTFAFTRFDYDRDGHTLPQAADRTFPAQAILRDGSIVAAPICELPWYDLIAFRAQEGRAAVSSACEELIDLNEAFELHGEDVCESCASYGDFC